MRGHLLAFAVVVFFGSVLIDYNSQGDHRFETRARIKTFFGATKFCEEATNLCRMAHSRPYFLRNTHIEDCFESDLRRLERRQVRCQRDGLG